MGGKHTLKTIFDYPELIRWIDFDANTKHGIDVHKVYASTVNCVWFRTPNGISFYRQAVAVVKSYLKYGFLPHQTKGVIPGWNDILTLKPELKPLIDVDRNIEHGVDVTRMTLKSGQKVYAFCSNCGKPVEKPRFLFSITRNGHVFCNKCSRSLKTSFQEQTLFYYIWKMFPSTLNGCRCVLTNNMELDIYIPEYKLGIEYDGGKWHKEHIARSIRKYELCKNNGIYLVKMTDLVLDVNDSDTKFYSKPNPTNDNYQEVIDFVARYTNYKGERIVVNIEKDRYEILKRYKKTSFEKSFAYKIPEALKYWNYEMNGNVDPYDISANDTNKFWFTSPGYGDYKKSPNQITSGKTSVYHPKEAIEQAWLIRHKKIVVFDVKSGKRYSMTYRDASVETGLSLKNISKRVCEKNIFLHLTRDRRYILLNISDRNDDEIREILLAKFPENDIILTKDKS